VICDHNSTTRGGLEAIFNLLKCLRPPPLDWGTYSMSSSSHGPTPQPPPSAIVANPQASEATIAVTTGMSPNHRRHDPSTLQLRRKDHLKVEFKDPPATLAAAPAATTAAPGRMEYLPPELHVLTLNCWGLKHISALRSVRLLEIGRRIAKTEPTPNIVALQECWCQEDYRAVRRETRFALPYGKFYHSGAFGGGLVILSKWPIEESSMFRYPLNGRPTAFWRGDWYVGKGVACAKIRIGPGKRDVVEVFNTHVSELGI